MGGNQQVPRAAGNPRYNDPGLDPSPDPKIVVKAVNPPVTPDQVVGMAEMPSAATLDLPKIQNIKIPPVKNKTIQGHLKAIEAKMTATEKLMKDVVKLQKLQIITEKELFERKRELYQNTFEEYLLDKTVDFENPDDPGGANSIKKGPGGFGFPFGGGRRRRKGRPPGGGSGAAAATAGAAGAATTADTKQDQETPVKATTPLTTQQQPNLSQEQVEELIEQLTEKRKELDPNYDPMEQEAPIPTITRPGDPVTAPEKFVPDPVDVPKPDVTPADIQRTIEVLRYAQENGVPEPAIRRKDGFIVRLSKDGRPRVFKPGFFDITGINAVLSKSLQFTQTFLDAVPSGSFRGRRLTGTPPRVFRPRQPDKRPPVIKQTNTTPRNTVSPGPNNPRALPPGERGGDLVPAAQAKSDILPFQRQQQKTSAERGGQLDTAGPTVDVTLSGTSKTGAGVGEVTSAPVGETAPSSFRAAERAQYQSMTKKELEQLIRRERINQRKALRKEPTESQKLQLEVLQEKYGMDDAVINQASGGVGDIDLYSSKSLNYFRGISSKIVPMADGGLVGWWNKGRNMRVPSENTASWKDLMKDDAKQITRTNKAFKSGATGIKGWNPLKAFTPEMVRTGPTPAVRQAFERPARTVTHPLMMALEFIVNDLLLNPRSTAVYDQVTGPNAYYNDPAYKGPMPSQNLENAQSSMMSGNDPKVEVKPLPPDYIKIPGKKKAPDFVGTESPDIEMRSSIFSRSSTHID